MCAQIMSLTWDNHHSLLISVLKELLERDVGVKCTIVAEGHQMKVHQVLLSSFSPFFEFLFKERNDEHPTIILADTSYQDLKALIHYMYQGKLEIPQNQMKNLLETAKSLQLKGLSETSTHNSSEKENTILGLQTHSDLYMRKRKHDDAVQNDIKESYSDNTQDQTSSVYLGYHVGQSPAHCMTSDETLQVCSVQKLSSFPVPSTSYSLEPNSLPLHDETVVKSEPQDETFCAENMHEYEPERPENKEINIWDSSRNSSGQGIGEETSICESTNSIVRSEENSQEYAPLQDYTSSYMFNLPHGELPSPMTSRPLCNTSNASSASGELASRVPCLQLGNAIRGSPLSYVNPAELESDEFIDSELNIKPEDVTEEETIETVMLDETSLSSMEQEEPLVEDEHIARSECSVGVKSQFAASREKLFLSCSSETGFSGTTGESPTYLTNKSGTETPGMQHGNVTISNDTRCFPKNFENQEFQESFHSSSLDQHMRRPRDIAPYECSQCDYKSNIMRNLKKHMGIHKAERPYKCRHCDFTANKNNDLLRHLCIHTGEKPYKCMDCKYASSRKSTLKTHRRIHTGEKPYKCGECDYTSVSKADLLIHHRLHTGERPYKCMECDYTSASKCNLTMHQSIHTAPKVYNCTLCDYTSTIKGNLIKHHRIHTGETPYKCTECNYASAYKSNLKMHHRIHTAPRLYKCVDCDYATDIKTDLTKHHRIHTGEKPYKCTECDYASDSKCNLKMHQYIHTAPKIFKCEECGYTTTIKNDLVRHNRIHAT